MREVLRKAALRVSSSDMSEESASDSEDEDADEFVRMVAENEEDSRRKGRLFKTINKAIEKEASVKGVYQMQQSVIEDDMEGLLGRNEADANDFVVPLIVAKGSPVGPSTPALTTGRRAAEDRGFRASYR